MVYPGRAQAGAARSGSAPAAGPSLRPLLQDAVHLDEDDAVVAYGRRWVDGETAEASYERIGHPEGFAVRDRVALALAARLGGQPWIQFGRKSPVGNSSRGREGPDGPNAFLEDARTMPEMVPGGWHPWPLRAST
ncbi:DUF6226 family protein [Paeniglutamicibacter sp.]|uniref:DUF6226 family protein n=1 Tax=Paeniglutamicibacter sp. TaxID=1934391 RepID=UPI0039892186